MHISLFYELNLWLIWIIQILVYHHIFYLMSHSYIQVQMAAIHVYLIKLMVFLLLQFNASAFLRKISSLRIDSFNSLISLDIPSLSSLSTFIHHENLKLIFLYMQYFLEMFLNIVIIPILYFD